jgi:hypothetical protein
LMRAGLGWMSQSENAEGLMFALLEHPLTASGTSNRHPASRTRRVPDFATDDEVISSWVR